MISLQQRSEHSDPGQSVHAGRSATLEGLDPSPEAAKPTFFPHSRALLSDVLPRHWYRRTPTGSLSATEPVATLVQSHVTGTQVTETSDSLGPGSRAVTL